VFDACEREPITRLATLHGAALQAEALAEHIFSNNHPIHAMLFDLQALGRGAHHRSAGMSVCKEGIS